MHIIVSQRRSFALLVALVRDLFLGTAQTASAPWFTRLADAIGHREVDSLAANVNVPADRMVVALWR